MSSIISVFNFFSYLMINVIVIIYQTLYFLHIPFALGFSIIILTVIIRLILYPLKLLPNLRLLKKCKRLHRI